MPWWVDKTLDESDQKGVDMGKKNKHKEAEKQDQEVEVYWTPGVRRRVWALIDNLKTEVGGFGYAALEDEGRSIIWYQVFLVPQEVARDSVDYEGGSFQYAIEKAANDGVLGRPDHIWVKWHSHNSMDTFWSPTDEEDIEINGNAGMPMLLSMVGNHKHQYKARIDFFDVKHFGITIPKVTMNDLVIGLDGEEPVDPFQEAIRAEIAEYVQERKFGYQTGWKSDSNDKWKSGSNGSSDKSAGTSVVGPVGHPIPRAEPLEETESEAEKRAERLAVSQGPETEVDDDNDLEVLEGASMSDDITIEYAKALGIDIEEIVASDRFLIIDDHIVDLGPLAEEHMD